MAAAETPESGKNLEASEEDGEMEESDEVVLLKQPPQPVARDSATAYLEPYGYVAQGPTDWSHGFKLPEMSLEVTGYQRSGGHYYYNIQCELARQGEWHSPYLRWKVGRRLGHLRDSLHDLVKKELGASYGERFDKAHFAHSFGQHAVVRGTKGRLRNWFLRLAQCMNKKHLSPVVAATILQVLQAPDAATIKDKRGIGTSPSNPEVHPNAPGAGRISRGYGSDIGTPASNLALSGVAGDVDANPFGPAGGAAGWSEEEDAKNFGHEETNASNPFASDDVSFAESADDAAIESF
eukprot:TRINITY_DN13253_c0_g1_i1.p1 TRINITY_DN13253_c0_g1~~TRINITY_DN13253_c0_g1_i1.p1  ORF type:complete len:294 (+),score=44.32 TRINITY_DN13253_c0_g1_i1:79-960(+)